MKTQKDTFKHITAQYKQLVDAIDIVVKERPELTKSNEKISLKVEAIVNKYDTQNTELDELRMILNGKEAEKTELILTLEKKLVNNILRRILITRKCSN